VWETSRLVFKAHRPLDHSTLGLRVIKEKKKKRRNEPPSSGVGTNKTVKGWLAQRGTSLGGVPREQKMLKGHLPRVIYHQVYKYTKMKIFQVVPFSLGSGLGVVVEGITHTPLAPNPQPLTPNPAPLTPNP